MVLWDQGGCVPTQLVRIIYTALPQAFLLYTVDKIVASLIKQVRSLMGSCGATSKFKVGSPHD